MSFRLKEYKGGANPVGREELHIYRDPPKSVHTRKKERVNIADVMYMVQSDNPNGDPSRFNENIMVVARGRNPHVKVDYGAGRGASNPYKVEVVRPPINPIETQVPISAPRIHQNYSMHSNPSMAPFSNAGQYDRAQTQNAIVSDINNGVVRSNPSLEKVQVREMFDRTTAKANGITLKGMVRPTVSMTLDTTRENNTIRSTAVRDIDPFGVTSNINFGNVVVYDPKSNNTVDVTANIRDKNYIAVTAAGSKNLQVLSADKAHSIDVGKQIVSDVRYSSASAAPSQRVDTVGDDVQKIKVNQDRLYTVGQTNSKLGGYNEQMSRMTDEYRLNEKVANLSMNNINDRTSRSYGRDSRMDYNMPSKMIKKDKREMVAF